MYVDHCDRLSNNSCYQAAALAVIQYLTAQEHRPAEADLDHSIISSGAVKPQPHVTSNNYFNSNTTNVMFTEDGSLNEQDMAVAAPPTVVNNNDQALIGKWWTYCSCVHGTINVNIIVDNCM